MSKNTIIIVRLGLILLVAAAFGCGGAGAKGKTAVDGAAVGPDGERMISKKARKAFIDVAERYKATEKTGWNPEACKSVASKFEKVAKRNNNMPEALYNVGVVYGKCKMKNEARAAFKTTLKHHPKHQLSLTHLAVLELEDGNESGAEDYLRKAVAAGKNKVEVVPAYVNVATILRVRGVKTKSGEKMSKAQMNLRRALAIDSKYMPALYQLAMLYLDTAVMKNQVSYLTLATLVCNQGISLDPEYGPIYHALGQVQLRQNKLVDALKAFETAFMKDPSLFSSYMNYAAINLSFRGYEEAKAAFEKAIALNAKNYDAHIGLGVALRGIGDFEGAKAEYKKASEINPKRTDYIFNMGVLEMDYTNPGTPAGFEKAKSVFKKFVSRSTEKHRIDPDGKGPRLSWHAKADARITLCKKNIKMIAEAEREMAEMEKLQKEQAKREAEMHKQMEKAKALEEKEASGAVAPEEGGEAKAAEPAEKKGKDK